jgi:hypothetical protein
MNNKNNWLWESLVEFLKSDYIKNRR